MMESHTGVKHLFLSRTGPTNEPLAVVRKKATKGESACKMHISACGSQGI